MIEQQERKKKREFVKRMKESLNLLVRRDSRKFKNIENSDNHLKNQVEKEDRVAILSFEKKKKFRQQSRKATIKCKLKKKVTWGKK